MEGDGVREGINEVCGFSTWGEVEGGSFINSDNFSIHGFPYLASDYFGIFLFGLKGLCCIICIYSNFDDCIVIACGVNRNVVYIFLYNFLLDNKKTLTKKTNFKHLTLDVFRQYMYNKFIKK